MAANRLAPPSNSPAGNNGTGNGRQGSVVRSGPDGSVYVAWEQGFNQVIAISRDGGKKWSRPAALLAPVADIHDPIPKRQPFPHRQLSQLGRQPRSR
ncbi:MAG: hypothetical protein R2911_02460 [Caldilineaceae bacterium]